MECHLILGEYKKPCRRSPHFFFCMFLCLLFVKGLGQRDSLTSVKDSLRTTFKKGGENPLPTVVFKDTVPASYKKKVHIPTLTEVRILEKKVLDFANKQIPPSISEIYMPMDSGRQRPSVTYKRALILPGWGQAYNRSYWKIPIVYAGLGTAGYFAYFNHKEYKKYQLAYLYAIDNDPNTLPTTIDPDLENAPPEGIRTYREQYRANRDNMILVFAGLYTLQAIEAYIHTHLKYFDVSDDLSIHVYPYMEPDHKGQPGYRLRSGLSATTGIGLKLYF